MTHKAVDGVQFPCLFQCFEAETIRRWQREGLPRDVHLAEHFGFDQIELAPVNLGPIPAGDLADSEDALEWRIGTDREHTDEAAVAGNPCQGDVPPGRPDRLARDAAPSQLRLAGTLSAILGRLRRVEARSRVPAGDRAERARSPGCATGWACTR